MKKKARPEETVMRINRLGQYNAEKARGLIHTNAWKKFMEHEQEWFNSHIAIGGVLVKED